MIGKQKVRENKGLSNVISVLIMIGLVLVVSTVIGNFAMNMAENNLQGTARAGVDVDREPNGSKIDIRISYSQKFNSDYILVKPNTPGPAPKLNTVGDSEVITVPKGTYVSIIAVNDKARTTVYSDTFE